MNQKTNGVTEAMLEQANQLLKEGRFDDAVESFNACLAVSPDTPQAYRGRGQAQFQMKKWDEAISDFSRAKVLDPEDLESRLGLGLSLAMVNQIYEAIDVLEEVLKKAPSLVRGYIYLGQLHFKLCAIAKGKEQMQLALNHKPTLAERRMIEQILKEEKKLDEKRFYRPDFEALRKQRKNKE